MEQVKKSEKRLYLSPEKAIILRDKIKDFAKHHGVREYMAELFINEVRLSTDEANAHLRERAQIMGLME